MNKRRKKLLAELESLVGNTCYNGNIQNWGPGGEWQGEGRSFRYPITFINKDGEKDKRWTTDPSLPLDRMQTGYYAFGANQLHIIRALDKVLSKLENEYGLKI